MRARSGRRRLSFEVVGSTNARALEAAIAGDPGPLWITAERQTEGRGRRGRSWASPPGGLYATLLLIDPAPIEHLANLPLVVAVGIADGIARLHGIDGDAVRIKWPNDILIGGAKCVGILIESERLANGHAAVAIGAGVNLEPPGATDASYPIAALREHGFGESIETLFEALASGVEAALGRWDRGRGFAGIRREWVARAKGIGEPARVNLSDRSVEGRFVELDETGRLVLETAAGKREVFSAGDLFFSGVSVPVPV